MINNGTIRNRLGEQVWAMLLAILMTVLLGQAATANVLMPVVRPSGLNPSTAAQSSPEPALIPALAEWAKQLQSAAPASTVALSEVQSLPVPDPRWLDSLISGVDPALLQPLAWQTTLGGSPAQQSVKADPATRARVLEAFGRTPLHFEPNQGQTDPTVKFLARVPGYQLLLTPNEAVLAVRGQTAELPVVVRMQLTGAGVNPQPVVEGLAALPGQSNYYLGNDPQRWQTAVPHFAKVRYGAVYPGVDWELYGNPRQLEYDFVVAPGADPNLINLSFAGADGARLGADGELVVAVAGQEVLHSSPTIYQVVNGERQIVTGGYVLRESAGDAPVVGFEIAAYDRELPLVIDPLVYFTFVGGTPTETPPATIPGVGGDDYGYGVAVDAAGVAYITGSTSTNNVDIATAAKKFPISGPFIDNTFNGGTDVFVTRMDAAGTIIYSTYFGGSAFESGYGIAVDSVGNAYITGYTNSGNFPTSNDLSAPNNALQGTQDAFVARINASGALGYSSYLGGLANEAGYGIAVNTLGQAYVTGYTTSADFPDAVGGPPSGEDTFIVQVLPTAPITLWYSTLTGAAGNDRGQGIVLDAAGTSAYITGFLSAAATQAAFIAKANTTGAISYITQLDGPGNDRGLAIARDDATGVYITGYTTCPTATCAVQPTGIATAGVYDTTFNGLAASQDAFVAKYTDAGVLVYASYLGGAANDVGYGITVDSFGNAYVAGETFSPNFPMVSPDDSSWAKGEAFLSRFNSDATQLTYSSFWGGAENDSGRGIAKDFSNNVYMVGYTNSPNAGFNFGPITPYRSYSGGADAFTAKFSIPIVNADFSLAVQLQGSGSGKVGSVPQGIGQTTPCHITNGILDANADCDASYPINTSVTLTATPDASFAFVGWAGAGSGTCAGSVALTCVVLMDEAKTVVANFAPANSLTVIKAGTGSGTVTSSPVGINCGAACLSDNSTFSTGTVVTLTATVQPGSTFAGWTNAISPFECNNSTSLTCQVTISTAKSVTATFTLDQFTLTVSKAGAGAATGTVTSVPAGIACGATCQASYAPNTLVTLTATAGTGFTFTGWTAGACTGTDPCAVTMDDAKSVTATFLPNRTLSVTKSGNGTGTVTSSPAGINCGADCTEVYAPGTSVALTAAAGVNATFVGWSGACTGTGVCTVTMDAAESVDAQFNITNELSVVVQAATGSSGAVSSIPGGIDCSDAGLGSNCSEVYALNTMVTLTAAAGSNSAFVGWGGLCSGTIPTCVVSINGAQNLTAYFAPLLSVTVIKSGAGSGTVSSSPVGIDCGADCQQSYAQNTLVTLTATAQLGSTFGGWSGSCAGTETTCQVLVNAAKTVTADFIVSPQSFSLTAVKNGDGTGTVTSTPNGITCGAVCQASYAEDTVVSLTTTPGAGSAFEGWGGACLGTETGDPCKVTMTANQSVTARFTKIDPNLPDLVIPTLTSPGLSANGQRNVSFALTVKNQGAKVTGAFQVGLYFTLDDSVDPALDLNAGKVCSFTSLAVGATASCSGNIVLPAGLPAAGGYYLGAYADPQGNIKELSKDNNAAVTNTVNGVPTPKTFTVYQLTTVINRPGNGTVYSQPSGIACSVNTNCQIPLLAGDSVTLTATPATGFVFAGWSGACTGADVCNLIMSANRNVTANFSAKKAQTIGLYNPAVARFYLRNSNSAGASNITFSYGPANQGWIPLVGDWDGNGTQTIGLYNPAVARFYLRNSNSAGASNITFSYGPANQSWIPLVGDWDGNGTQTIGLYNPATARFYLRNSNSAGASNITFSYGPANQGWLPLVGDWDGNGTQTIGLYNPAAARFYLRNSNSAGASNITFSYGPANQGWLPLVGDWDGNGTQTIGLYNPATARFYLRNSNSKGAADLTFFYGPANAGWKPLIGDWNGPAF
jgi:uncharacterized repeat protein (TIGR02543 family)